MNDSQEILRASYAQCRRVARRARSSFHASFFLLPRAKRRAMEAVYAFMRHTDDLADSPQSTDRRRANLQQWRASLEEALAREGMLAELPGAGGATSLLPALADTVRRFAVPAKHLYDVIDGVKMDLEPRPYETFEDLAEYCQRVASAVGFACIHVWGFRGEEAFEPARKCGIAMQMTNILRDLKEDAENGRVYLPLIDLRDCDYSIEDLVEGVVDTRFRRLLQLEIDRTEQLYREGVELMDHLEPDGHRVFGMMMAVYQRLLDEIRHAQGELFTRRVSVRRWDKLRIGLRWLVLPPRKAALLP